MSVSVFFHCYAAGKWEVPTQEFLEAYVDSKLSAEGVLHLGLVGTPVQRADAFSFCRRFADTRIVAEADDGWEQVTLNALRSYPALGDHIAYLHTKGAAIVDEWQDAWRRSMYLSLVTDWAKCIPLMEIYDAVGCHWLLPTPGMPQRYPFYGGNCFWTTKATVARLPEPGMSSRYEAEAWLGSAEGAAVHAYDFTPGWPGWDTIRQEARPSA